MIQLTHTQWEGAEFPPRRWQAEAYDVAMEALAAGERGVIRAVMGAGKSRLIAELAASVYPDRHDVILITAPSVSLVEQLYATVFTRMAAIHGGRAAQRVGKWFGDVKDLHPITVCTHQSLPSLQAELDAQGKSVALWMADEAHRTNHKFALEFYQSRQPPMGVGFTATPYLADEEDCLALFEEELYAYEFRDALADKVIVPWRIEGHHDGVGNDHTRALDDVCVEMIKGHLTLHPDHTGITNARTVADSETFAQRLRDAGVDALTVHGTMDLAERERRMRGFRAGEFSVLVHVNVLVEGVDLPQVRFMCLRRPVTSRVRFAQEVGRGLRAAPGKTVCTLYDPLDLFGVLSLSRAAALSNGIDPDDLESRIQDATRRDLLTIATILEEAGFTGDLAALWAIQGMRAKLLSPVGRYLRRCVVAADVLWPDDAARASSRSWRSAQPSEKQVAFAAALGDRMFRKSAPKLPGGRSLPVAHHDMLRLALTNLEQLDRGQVSDLIGVMKTLKREDISERLDDFTNLAAGAA